MLEHDPESLAAQTPLTKRQARVVVHRANGESIENIAARLDEPTEAVRIWLTQAQAKATEADALLCHLPADFGY